MAGLEFFRRAVQYQAHHGQGKKIFNALQTNGLLLNEEWCEFLKLHDFLVGISIDGPRELHESYRKTRAGRGTFDKVIAAIEMLKQHEIPFNTLTVVNDINVMHPLRVYEFLKSIGSCHMQFIELLETTEPNVRFCEAPAEAKIVHFSVPAAQYGHFMAELFKAWVTKDVGKIFIRQFESFISRVLGNGHTSCIFQARCQDNFVIESNGDLYECDHFVYPDYKIGNIKRDEISHLHSDKLSRKKGILARECRECAYVPICNGGCPKHRIKPGDGAGISYFCSGYQILFVTMVPYLNAMVELERHKVPLVHIMDDRIAQALRANI